MVYCLMSIICQERFALYNLFISESVGVDFQEELSDMLLLKMLQAATRASDDKDIVSAFTLSLAQL